MFGNPRYGQIPQQGLAAVPPQGGQIFVRQPVLMAPPQVAPGQVVRDYQQPDPVEMLGVPPQDMINALYDIFGNYPRRNVLPYSYQFRLTSAEGTALTAGGRGRASIKVSADASFITNYLTGSSTGEYLIFMRTDSSDRILMNDPCHSATVVGTAERPLILPKPLLLAPNTTITYELQDLSQAENEIYFTMVGFKVYRRQYAMAG